METMIFKQRLVQLQGELLLYAYKLTSNYEDANDLTHETSLAILGQENITTQEVGFKEWVYGVMRTIFAKHYNKNNVLSGQTVGSITLTGGAEDMNSVVDALPDEYKTPFLMHTSGFKCREIAEKLNLSLEVVKSRLVSARQHLQELLK